MFGFGKSVDGLECPFVERVCIKDRCVGWQTGPTEQMVDGVKQTVLHSDCFVVWDLLYKKAIANRTDGTQAAAESLRNEVVRGNAQIQLMISHNRPFPYTHGADPKGYLTHEVKDGSVL